MEAILIRVHFKIKTDHQSLKYLVDQRISTPYQQKWLAKLRGYDYEVIYKKGRENLAVDALSRVSHTGQLQAITAVTSTMVNQIKRIWEQDPKLQQIISAKQQNVALHPHYTWEHDLLKRKGKLVVGDDAALKTSLIQLYHSTAVGGHSGIYATYHKMTSVLY